MKPITLSLALTALALAAAVPAAAQLTGDTIFASYTSSFRGPDNNFWDPAEGYVPLGANPDQPWAVVSDEDASYYEYIITYYDPVTGANFHTLADVDSNTIRIEWMRQSPGSYIPCDFLFADLDMGAPITGYTVLENTTRNDPQLAVSHTDTSVTISVRNEWAASSDTYTFMIQLHTDGVTAVPDHAPVATFGGAYPNPFNPSTTVAYSLAESGPVTVRIHDLQGRKVRTLVDGARSAGDHRVVWDGRDEAGRVASSGTYFVQVVAAGVRHGGKITLVK